MSDKPANRTMKITCALLVLAALAAPVAAQQADPLKSNACGAALASLQSARSAGAAAGAVEQLRAAAAGTCLGSEVIPTRPTRIARPPVAVLPPQIDVPQRVAPLPAPVLPPPPVAIQRPPMPAHCDAGGCWSNDGTHLRHVPPTLAGPQGLCTQQGGLVYCP
jgi:hypothetical protein